MYLGSWSIDDYVTFPCNTHTASTGAATDADSAPTYRVYEDETATPILTGSMALLDSSNTAGFYSERIQLTAGNGFEAGKSYTIYISATVDSVVGTMSHTLQILAQVDVAAIEGSDPSDTILASVTDDSTQIDGSSVNSVAGLIGALNDLSAAEVNAEVVDALNVDAYAEPGQAAPAATASLVAKIGYLFKAWRNKVTQTTGQYSLYNDAGDTVDQKATVSDNGTTLTKGEIGTGP